MRLREQVAKAMHECHPENDPKPWDWVVTDATRYAESQRQDADAAIAAIEATLLSDEVVEAAAGAVAIETDYYAYDGPFIGLMVQAKTTGEANAMVARAALQAALAAMTGTEGSK